MAEIIEIMNDVYSFFWKGKIIKAFKKCSKPMAYLRAMNAPVILRLCHDERNNLAPFLCFDILKLSYINLSNGSCFNIGLTLFTFLLFIVYMAEAFLVYAMSDTVFTVFLSDILQWILLFLFLQHKSLN